MNVAPGTTEITTASCGAALGGERRIVSMVGHMHAHGERFTAWKVDAAGTRMKIYETFQWEEPDYLVFNSVVQNPEPDTALRIGGGYSGVLTLGRGERIDYECEINNTTDAPLRWANEAYSAEMCNLIGTYSPAVGTWGCQNN